MVDKEPKIIHFPGLDQEDTSAAAGKQAAETPPHEPASSKKTYQVADDGPDDPISDEVKSAVHEQEKEDERKLLAIELPTALADPGNQVVSCRYCLCATWSGYVHLPHVPAVLDSSRVFRFLHLHRDFIPTRFPGRENRRVISALLQCAEDCQDIL